MHAHTCQALNICSWRKTTADALTNIASVPKLRALDVRWNRTVDDFVIKAILDGCPKLEEIKRWGHIRLPPRGAVFFFFFFFFSHVN